MTINASVCMVLVSFVNVIVSDALIRTDQHDAGEPVSKGWTGAIGGHKLQGGPEAVSSRTGCYYWCAISFSYTCSAND